MRRALPAGISRSLGRNRKAIYCAMEASCRIAPDELDWNRVARLILDPEFPHLGAADYSCGHQRRYDAGRQHPTAR